ncbi:uncharacterized protein FA14DRAFT_181768 [Meira miltonrushii]|uniref:Yeast cell wall synthesis Kre9/Knh1-like N-terminal domain-containing protein n=1 Tax=Meira miltonrushii TaxID=1280837 RepID=A0A316VC24_9BASI|nr:uncharacterized protein FA14DRAFT_181768 [Meira miltonrushii]PWN33105.1 hypothetical protein FA14DRAFT_181768 [Meira miltonrushii]
MTNLFSLTLATILSAFLLINFTHAFEITFPVGPSSSSYWVACKENILQWTYNETDPKIFSVALFNVDTKKLNGNYQIANSLQTVAGTAKVRPNCVEAGDGYFVGFVNSSQYALNHPEIYYSSPTFSIQPNTSQVQSPTSSSQSSITGSSSSSSNDTQSNAFGPANAGQTPTTDQAKTVKGAKDGAAQVKVVTAIALIAPLFACVSLYLSI